MAMYDRFREWLRKNTTSHDGVQAWKHLLINQVKDNRPEHHCLVIRAENIADWVTHARTHTPENLSQQIIGSLGLPAPFVWVEWPIGPWLRPFVRQDAGVRMMGALCVMREEYVSAQEFHELSAFDQQLLQARAEYDPLQARWCNRFLSLTCVAEDGGGYQDLHGKLLLNCRRDSTAVKWNRQTHAFFFAHRPTPVLDNGLDIMFQPDREAPSEWIGFAAAFAYAAVPLFALQCCNIPNIVLTKDPAHPAGVQKRRQQQEKLPLVRCHTIQLGIRVRYDDEDEKRVHGTSTAQTPFHLVRGHFADYRERGLFGKHRGVFWVPIHARGSLEHGVVKKRYTA